MKNDKKINKKHPKNWTEVHLIDIDRLGEDPGLVFCLQLVQKGSEQNTEGSQLHFQESFLLFNLQQTHKLKTFQVKTH